MRSRVVVGLVLVGALAAPSAAAAADRNGALAAVGSSFGWTGGPVSGVAADSTITDTAGCLPNQCDETLLQTGVRGAVTAKIGMASPGATDLDLYVYRSNVNGSQGELLKSSAGGTADETATTADVDPGFFLVRVVAATAAMGTFTGSATLGAPKAAADAPGAVSAVDSPTAAPLPPALPADASSAGTSTSSTAPSPGPNGRPATYFSTRRPAASGGRLVLRGTSADDGKVARVDVGLVRKAGGRCRALTRKGTFAATSCAKPALLKATGTTAWSLRLPRHLARGTYVAYARATDAGGAVERGFGKTNRVTFSVR